MEKQSSVVAGVPPAENNGIAADTAASTESESAAWRQDRRAAPTPESFRDSAASLVRAVVKLARRRRS